MWSAFLTGAAKQATTLIEERDKEIRDNMNIRMNEMYKRAEVAKKEAEERRDELTGLANELVGAGFDEREAAYLLQNPEQAKKIIAYADKTGGITAEKKQQLFSKNKEHLNALEDETPQEYIKRVTTLGTGGRTSLMAPGETEGAFGLPSRAAERGMSEFLAKAGRTKEDVMATELPSREIKPLGLDMTVFAEEEKAPTKAEVLASYAKKINDAKKGGDREKAASLEKERDEYISVGFPKDEDKEKALTFSNAMSGLQKSIAQAFSANSQKLGNSTFSIALDGTPQFAPGTPDHAMFFRDIVRKSIVNSTERYKDAEGRLPEPVAAAVNFMGIDYGIRVGKDRKIVMQGRGETPTPPPPTSSKPKGAASPAKKTIPTLEQFKVRARAANPGVSDAELEKYYYDKYGNK